MNIKKKMSDKKNLFFSKKMIRKIILSGIFTMVILISISFLIASLFSQYSSAVIDSRKNQLLIICKTVTENLSLGLNRQKNNFLYFQQSPQYQQIITKTSFSEDDKQK